MTRLRGLLDVRAMRREVHPRRVLRAAYRLVRSSDVALVYGAIVLVVAVGFSLLPADTHSDLVEKCSTNLGNLRHRPISVLVLSAFVVSNLAGLWLLPVLLIAYAAAQRWVGRAGVLVVAIIGHVGATLFVAVLLAAGIAGGVVDRGVRDEPDVGVSYGLACLAGFLLPRVPPRWRVLYLAVVGADFVLPLFLAPSFTELGHVTALCLGLALALLAVRVRSAAQPLPLAPRGDVDEAAGQ